MQHTFAALGATPGVVRALAAAGITEPRPIQAATIPDALSGRDVCGRAGTGQGKTLAFGIPLLQRTRRAQPARPTGLVLVPTRELAGQVHDVLVATADGHRRVAVCYGGVSIERQVKQLRRGVDILVATPGRLIDLLDRRALQLSDVSVVVLDEADRMADMGFIAPVERILRETRSDRQTLLFSATLDGDVDRIVKHHMVDPVTHSVAVPETDASGMTHHFLAVSEDERTDVLSGLAAGVARTLVFVRTKRGADRLAKRLARGGTEAAALHGDLSQNARQRSLDAFSAGTVPVLVATDVAARGLDVTGLDLVVHHDLPEDHKTFVHRSGRTARGDAEGVVVTFVLEHQHADVQRLQRDLGLEVPLTRTPGGPPVAMQAPPTRSTRPGRRPASRGRRPASPPRGR